MNNLIKFGLKKGGNLPNKYLAISADSLFSDDLALIMSF